MLVGKLHVDKLLTNFARAYKPTGFIADRVWPIINVDKQSDIYDVWSQADAFRVETDQRAPGTMANQVRLAVGSDNFYAENYELGAAVTAEDRQNADPSRRVMMESGRVAFVLSKLMLGWEDRLASIIMNTANAGSNAAVVSVWTGAGADPVGDINTAIDNVQHATGFRPNKMVMGVKPYLAMRRHTTIIDKSVNPNVTGGGRGYPTVEEIAQLFDLDEILIGRAYKNTANEGLAQAITPIWSNHVSVYYDPPDAFTELPRYGAVFNWASAPTGRFQVVRHPVDTERKRQNLTVGMYQDEKIVSADLSFLLTGATTN